MRKFYRLGLLLAPGFLLCSPGYAGLVTVDLSSATFGLNAPVSTQYAADGITFAAETTGGTLLTAETGGENWEDTDPIDGTVSGLSNSPTGEYPTTEFLDIFFTNPASSISFWYDNFGDSGAFYTAFGPGDTVLGTGSVGSLAENFNEVDVPFSGVTEIQIDNTETDTFTSGSGSSWEFGVSRVEFAETATPEPATGTLLAVGVLGLVVGYRRKVRAKHFPGNTQGSRKSPTA